MAAVPPISPASDLPPRPATVPKPILRSASPAGSTRSLRSSIYSVSPADFKRASLSEEFRRLSLPPTDRRFSSMPTSILRELAAAHTPSLAPPAPDSTCSSETSSCSSSTLVDAPSADASTLTLPTDASTLTLPLGSTATLPGAGASNLSTKSLPPVPGLPQCTFRSISFAPLPVMEPRRRKSTMQLGVAARSRMLADRRRRRMEREGYAYPEDPAYPPDEEAYNPVMEGGADEAAALATKKRRARDDAGIEYGRRDKEERGREGARPEEDPIAAFAKYLKKKLGGKKEGAKEGGDKEKEKGETERKGSLKGKKERGKMPFPTTEGEGEGSGTSTPRKTPSPERPSISPSVTSPKRSASLSARKTPSPTSDAAPPLPSSPEASKTSLSLQSMSTVSSPALSVDVVSADLALPAEMWISEPEPVRISSPVPVAVA